MGYPLFLIKTRLPLDSFSDCLSTVFPRTSLFVPREFFDCLSDYFLTIFQSFPNYFPISGGIRMSVIRSVCRLLRQALWRFGYLSVPARWSACVVACCVRLCLYPSVLTGNLLRCACPLCLFGGRLSCQTMPLPVGADRGFAPLYLPVVSVWWWSVVSDYASTRRCRPGICPVVPARCACLSGGLWIALCVVVDRMLAP